LLSFCSQAHVFFHEFRSSKTGKKAAQILVGIWRGEESKAGLSLNCQITNTKRPLLGSGVRTEWVPASDVAYGFQTKQRRQEIDHLTNAVDSEQIMRKVNFSVVIETHLDKAATISPSIISQE
jgi:hypothetical protein